MLTIQADYRPIARKAKLFVGVLLLICLTYFGGCVIPHGHCRSTLFLRGKVLNDDTMTGAIDVAVGVRTFTNGEETDSRSALIFDGTSRFPPPATDGSFQVEFGTPLMGCPPPYEFPRPDRVEIIVVRDGCEQAFLIDINEDTVVDMDFPDDVIELKDPILVPPCEE